MAIDGAMLTPVSCLPREEHQMKRATRAPRVDMVAYRRRSLERSLRIILYTAEHALSLLDNQDRARRARRRIGAGPYAAATWRPARPSHITRRNSRSE
jgi:hypothetical protein